MASQPARSAADTAKASKWSAIGCEAPDVNAMIWAREMVLPMDFHGHRVIVRSVSDVSDDNRCHAPLLMEQECKAG